MEDVIYAIYGKEIATSVLEVDYTYEDIRITGVVGKPEIARSNRTNQLFFVNQRFVKDKTLASAAENAFKGLLPIGKYGFLVLNVDIEPSKVDVNVHPAKLEIRFQEENKVFKAIYHSIKDTLLKAELIANTERVIDEQESFTNQAPQKSSITDLFRKITKPQEKEENKYNIENKDNLIEQIYNTREQITENNEQSEIKNLEQNTFQNEDKKMDVFKELMAMQERLKEEAKKDPSIQTNVDNLIQNTKELQDSSNVEENKETSVDLQQENQNTEIQENSSINYEEDNTALKEESNSEANLQVKENEEQYEVITEGTVDEAVSTENIEIPEENLSEDVSQNTKAFTSEEIQEMMDKLETIDNVEGSQEFANMYEEIFGKLPASVEEEKKKEEEKINAYELIKDNNISVFENIPEYQKPVYKLVGIAFNTYIIIEIKDELYIIDQHAAHERVMYEKVKKNYYSDMNKDSQMLLLPDIITLTHKEIDILKDNIEMFEKAGFVLEEFGDNTIKLSGVPDICLELDTKELFLETLDEINQVARTAKQEIEERFIATVACKAAVKAHMDLTPEEVDSLMNELLILPNPFTCPHGRPTAIKMDKNDIEKKFSRRK